mgnify:CR=1 FL=1
MSTETVTLINRDATRGKFIGELPHDIICQRLGVCSCAKQPVLNSNGKRVTARTPASFTVFVGGKTEVPALALGLKPVKRALEQGWLYACDTPQPSAKDAKKPEAKKETAARDEAMQRMLPSVTSTPSELQTPSAQVIALAKAKAVELPAKVKEAIDKGTEQLKSAKRSK